ncbi:cytochrome C biogenesis protein [Phyllobacterium brassicacearum]|uniref:Cytochrome C biogenesis protein n=1 Tax=Phyllobacterium brassicacearum TaxID=314235 RepID=A0A2P7BPQ8_9HYPH|nr:cytochrome c biogenesis protein DipZ [Phyllobacterium brassicacearum]PSH68468.1 cytochrome C biogenesis protein [Phyllobacterium brassicacearum]
MALLVISYLAGVLTILSPCILPVLPFVFARAGRPFVSSMLPMLAGMALTFAGVATLAAVGGSWAVHANEYGRYTAIILLAVFGVTLVSPQLATVLTRPVVAFANRLLNSTGGPTSFPTAGGAIILGIATGLLWAPCAGPILGLVLTGAALQGANVQTTLLLLAYSAGAATSLALALLIGGQAFAVMKGSLGAGEWVRRALGIAVLCGVAAIGLGADTGILTRLSSSGTNRIEQALLNAVKPTAAPDMSRDSSMVLAGSSGMASRSDLPVEGKFPSLDGAVEWLNSPPLTNEQLRGKVVLIDFWTYSCINCIRTVPYVRAWSEKYKDQGLVVIGVHAPEFAFEKKIDNVKKAISDFQITYPVAIDNNFKIWRAFRNSYWPAHYFIDAKGQIRYQHFGEGDHDKSEKVIQDLLAEAGSLKAENKAITPDLSGAQAAPDLGNIGSSETYIGYQRASNFASPEAVKSDAPLNYTAAEPGLNEWGLSGNWTIGPEQATLNRSGGAITYRFRARDLHLVLGPSADGKPVRFQVTVDGRAPAESHGSDIDADGNGTVTQTRLYQMVRQAGDVKERTFEVRFLDPGVEAFAFTFG